MKTQQFTFEVCALLRKF